MSDQPRVGIALAVYNPDLLFLKEQMLSLQNQTLGNWICVISDDSPAVETQIKINDLAQQDKRFRYLVNRGSKGVLRNFENALRNLGSDFDYYCFCDQDDLWEPDKLEFLVQMLNSHQSKSLAHSDLTLIDEEGQLLESSCWAVERRHVDQNQKLLDLVLRNSVTGCSLMFKRKILKKILPFPAEVSNEYLHDHWAAVVAHLDGGILPVHRPLVRYRQHSQNVIGASRKSTRTLQAKLRKILTLRERSTRALQIRQRMARDLIARVNEIEPSRIHEVQRELAPLIQPSAGFYLKGLIRTRGKWPEFGLWLQLFLSSLFSWAS